MAEPKYKIGDRVIITLPEKSWYVTNRLEYPLLDIVHGIGEIVIIKRVSKSDNDTMGYVYDVKGNNTTYTLYGCELRPIITRTQKIREELLGKKQ